VDVLLSRKAQKFIDGLNDPVKSRIIDALEKLQQEPPEGDIKPLYGDGGFRLRVGGYRILFSKTQDNLVVAEIGSRGQIYKKGH
jgi:mRNA interferase RelE/StbE